METPDQLPREVSDAIDAARTRLGPFHRLHYYRDVGSTNDIALAVAAAGAVEGTAVLADHQRAGRGRMGRTWFSPPGAGLYLSAIVRPGSADWLSLTTLAAGVAVARALVMVSALPIGLKWPNDLVIGQPWRKIGGVLCESSGSGAEIDALVVGIGVNLDLASTPPELAAVATSVEAELGRPVDRWRVVVEVLAELHGLLARLRAGDRAWVCDEWRRFGRAGLLGARVRWDDQGIERTGLARDLDETGALLVESAGKVERLIAGDVRWDRPGVGRERS
ncbi:MAG TPA: biotin--[acetyl-CoA-carboxylase] ligase [Vicinamibacterales bacterium]|nr:biotin--[acetyl-CoA-carboxylase] ligase [Vicinamibacterales bacterium]